MKKNLTSKSSNARQSIHTNPKSKIQITTIAALISAITGIFALCISLYQNKSSLREKAPIFSLKQVEIRSSYPDNSRLIVTVGNRGQRPATFRYAYTYVLNTAKKTAIANRVFTTYEILPNDIFEWNFAQPKDLTKNPYTYYCTKIWYDDDEIENTEPKELFYKLKNLEGINEPTSIPNDVLKIFKAEIAKYENSSSFKSSDT